MERKIFMFGTTVVIQETKPNDVGEHFEYIHRLIIGTIASEWTGFHFPAHLTLGGRTFISIIDGRSIFPTVFEVVSGLEKV